MAESSERLLTTKGRLTRDRIVRAAAALMVERGVASVSLDEVGRATSTSKSQMYHYFASKDELIDAVVDHVGTEVLDFQGGLLANLDSIAAVERWADAIVAYQRREQRFSGCPLGSLANDLSGDSFAASGRIEDSFATWHSLLEAGITTMVGNGVLRQDADPHLLAAAILALLQGGLMMAKATQDEASLRVPLDAAIDYLCAYRRD